MAYTNRLGILCKPFQYLSAILLLIVAVQAPAQHNPPGLVRTLQVESASPLVFPVPFYSTESSLQAAFAGQIESSGLIVTQWDAASQTWLTATYIPGLGWNGDTITIRPGIPLSVQLPAGEPSISLSLSGKLSLNPLTQTIYPGLNHVSSPRFSTEPLTVWNWDEFGVAGSSAADSDVLYMADSTLQAWLEDDLGFGKWVGDPDPLVPGVLSPLLTYFYEHKGTEPITVSEEGQIEDFLELPDIVGVTYDPVNDQVEVGVFSDVSLGTTVDLFFQDILFPSEYDEDAPWQVWQLNAPLINPELTTFIDAGSLERPHPTSVDLRLYYVGTSFDIDQDGLSDIYEQLVSKTNEGNPDTDGDGVFDGKEIALGTDPTTADTPDYSQQLIVDALVESQHDDTGRLVGSMEGVSVLTDSGIVGGNTVALELQGYGQQLNFSGHPDFNAGGPYTERSFSIWFAVDEFTSGKQVLFESGGSLRGFNAYIDGQTLYVGAWDSELDTGDTTTWPGSWLSTQNIQSNTWHHLVLVVDASEQPTQLSPGVLRAYLDGQEIAAPLEGMQVTAHGGLASLGGVVDSTLMHDGSTTVDDTFLGVLDGFQVWNRALTETDVAFLYYPVANALSDRSWFASPIADFPFDTDYLDKRGNLILDVTGAPQLQSEGIVGNGSLHFNGTGYLKFENTEIYNLGGPYDRRTVSLWFTTDHYDFGRQMIFETGGSIRGMNIYLENGILYAGAWDSALDAAAGDVETWAGSWQNTNRIQPNTWHHVVLVLDASSDPTQVQPGVLAAYLDGVPFENGSTEGMQIHSHGDDSGLGTLQEYTVQHDAGASAETIKFYGGLDDVKIWNRALSVSEVTSMYQSGSANGVIPQWDENSFYSVYNMVGSLGDDPDGDGYSNAYEIGRGMDPNVADYNPALAVNLVRDVWLNVPGTYVSNLTSLPSYPFSPDQSSVLTNLFEAPENFGDNYGQRVSGRFWAPRTGNYRFHISGDDRCELWLTTPEAGRQLIASVPGYTDPGVWDKYEEQTSGFVHLQAGQTYVIEALMKEGSGGDHLEVGISFPTSYTHCGYLQAALPVSTKYFEEPPQGTSFVLDGDNDGLTDFEEWVHGSDPAIADSDGDGAEDGWEVENSFDPTNSLSPAIGADSDSDGLDDLLEAQIKTNARKSDSDCDGADDQHEAQVGTDPLFPDNPNVKFNIFTPYL